MLACLYLLLSILNTSASVVVRSTHMTTTDGLANNSVCYVFQDSKGFIWMGTLNGLSRYDGQYLRHPPARRRYSIRTPLPLL